MWGGKLSLEMNFTSMVRRLICLMNFQSRWYGLSLVMFLNFSLGECGELIGDMVCYSWYHQSLYKPRSSSNTYSTQTFQQSNTVFNKFITNSTVSSLQHKKIKQKNKRKIKFLKHRTWRSNFKHFMHDSLCIFLLRAWHQSINIRKQSYRPQKQRMKPILLASWS